MGIKTQSVIGQKKLVTVTKTRPSNTTAYTAEDVVSESASAGTSWVFDAVVPQNGGSGTIVGAILQDDDTGHTQIMKLYLYNVVPTSVLNDNLAHTGPLAADADNFVGMVTFPALVDEGGFSHARAQWGAASAIPLPFVTDADDAIYGVLTTAGYTPTSAEVFRITLIVDTD